MIMSGVFQAFAGLIAIFENEFYVATRNYLFQFDATTWGWIHPASCRHRGVQPGPASASIVAVGTTPSTRRASSVSRVTNASACSWVSAMYSAS